MFFENAYIARKGYIKAKDQTNVSVNKITKVDLNLYLVAINAKAAHENNNHNQQAMEQNAALLSLLQEQQKKFEELIKQSKNHSGHK